MRFFILLATLFLSAYASADAINFGEASKYNAFIKEDYSVTSSDVEGRVAVGGNLNVNGQYDIGTKINEYGMGSGPSLVVGGNINKTSQNGNFNVYGSGGDVVLGGTLTGGPAQIGSLTEESDNLPVDFDDAFSHLNSLSQQLSERTASSTTQEWGALNFDVDPKVTPVDGVYVFNVTQEQLDSTYTWYLNMNGLAEDATVVFNIKNNNGSGVNFAAKEIILVDKNGPEHLSNYKKSLTNEKAPVQVLYNFYGASELNLQQGVYGSVLAPNADITAVTGEVYGQVVGKSWDGNMQINYNPFEPVGKPPKPVPEPTSMLIFSLALLLLFGKKQLTLAKNKLIEMNSKNQLCFF